MTSRTRYWVLIVSSPVIAFAVIGGFLGQVMAARDGTYQHLRVFQDVVGLVVSNYVEPVDVRQAMRGAMHGLTEGLDSDSTYLSPELTKQIESNVALGPAEIGVEITRQYYLRVVSTRDGSPAAKAGIRTGDFIRAIDGRATRDMSPYEGKRLLHGAPGSKVTLLVIRGNAADPHELGLVRERLTAPDVTSRAVQPGTGYIRVAEFTKDTPTRIKQAADTLGRSGATRLVIDLRGTSRGDLDEGVAAARLFVSAGTLSVHQAKDRREVVTAQPGDGAITAPVALLIDQGTARAAEVFAAALDGNDRAQLIGDRSIGLAARQKLIKLPDGSGLWLTNLRYLTPANAAIHEKGLEPDVPVASAEVEFGSEPPVGDPVLDRAIEVLTEKKAA